MASADGLHVELCERIIGAAITVHRELGPGLLESAYEACLCRELALNGLKFQRQLAIPLIYKGESVEVGYRADIIVAEAVLLELKAIEALNDVHVAQVLTYLRLSGLRVGLLMNFNAKVLAPNIKRLVL